MNNNPIDEPIRIQRIITEEVTEPRADGTRGSALYEIPFKLNRMPSDVWTDIFLNEWSHPKRSTQMHRPKIASIVGDRIILDGTTIDEVKKYHKETLELCVEESNKKETDYWREQTMREERKRQQSEEHRKKIEKEAKDIEFK
jgi:predicted RNase H-like HicB family nuclease